MNRLRAVCVYCGTQTGVEPAYLAGAQTLGRALAGAKIRLVYGGASIGIMGAIARAVLEEGGEVTGIIPEFLTRREGIFDSLTQTIITKSMHERKQLMFEHADGFVALPGGIGTLEELVEMMTWLQLGRHKKPIVLGNINGFWQPFVDLIGHMTAQGFIHGAMPISFKVAEKAEDILPKLLENNG